MQATMLSIRGSNVPSLDLTLYSYNELCLHKKIVLGGMDAWKSFLYGTLKMSLISHTVQSISYVQIIDLYQVLPEIIWCRDAAAAKQIVKNILSGSDMLQTVICQNVVWLSKVCYPNSNDLAVSSLCVNCVDPCLGKVTASSSSIPLLLSDNDVFHGFEVSMLPLSMAPSIQNIYIISIYSNKVIIGVDTIEPSLVYCMAKENKNFPSSVYEVLSGGMLNMTRLGVTPFSSRQQHSTFIFDNLNTLHAYRITCLTVSIEGDIMSYGRMKKYSIIAQTSGP